MNIYKGVKRWVEFKMLSHADRQDLVSWRHNLIVQLAAVDDKKKQESILRGIRDIDKILN
jgi:predicted RNase H-like nuclease